MWGKSLVSVHDGKTQGCSGGWKVAFIQDHNLCLFLHLIAIIVFVLGSFDDGVVLVCALV